MSNTKILLEGMGINPFEKIDDNDDSYWTLHELIDHCREQLTIPVVTTSIPTDKDCINAVSKQIKDKGFKIIKVKNPKETQCKCGNEFLIYNDREGLNVCTLCGKSDLPKTKLNK